MYKRFHIRDSRVHGAGVTLPLHGRYKAVTLRSCNVDPCIRTRISRGFQNCAQIDLNQHARKTIRQKPQIALPSTCRVPASTLQNSWNLRDRWRCPNLLYTDPHPYEIVTEILVLHYDVTIGYVIRVELYAVSFTILSSILGAFGPERETQRGSAHGMEVEWNARQWKNNHHCFVCEEQVCHQSTAHFARPGAHRVRYPTHSDSSYYECRGQTVSWLSYCMTLLVYSAAEER